MNKTLHKADLRGAAEYGWLSSRHTFSFAGYHDPARMGFGSLRVINDDVVQPSMGFGSHPHENMEIVSIPLTGGLRHHDSMGNTQNISAGEVQIMSAGTGVTHSEYNGSDSEPVNFLQIWILPKELDISPRYDQKVFSSDQRQGRFRNIVSPDQNDDGVWINQDAWFWLGDFEAGQSGVYPIKAAGHGAYFFVLEGAIAIDGQLLVRRDGLAVDDTASVEFEATENCQLLVMEVQVNQPSP